MFNAELLPFVFLLALGISVMLSFVGRRLAPKPVPISGKTSSYMCGEVLPERRLRVNIRRFYLYVAFYMIFDISGFMLVMSYSSRGLFPALFVIIVMCSLVSISFMKRREEKRA